MRTLKAPSVLLVLSGIIVFLGIQIAEANFIGDYSTARNYLSDLGVDNDSAVVFNLTMFVSGILITVSSLRLRKLCFSRLLWIALLVYGIGTAGVGVFPGNISPLHGIAAGLLFITGPIAAIASKKYCTKGISRLVVGLGILSILFLISFTIEQNPSNVGIVERLVVYPITIWLIVFGAQLSRVDLSLLEGQSSD